MPLLIIDEEKCIGCGACVAVCPFAALELVDGIAVVNDSCTACRVCLSECPEDALSLPENKPVDVDLSGYQGVWVWVEQFQGRASDISWEMMGQGRVLANQLGAPLTACVLGEGVEDVACEAIAYGADRVFLADHPTLCHYRTQPYARVLIDLVREFKPEVFLLGASSRGRDLAGSVATHLYTGLTADCTGLEIDPDTRLLRQTRPAYGGNIMATILTPHHRPQMATVRHRVFEMPQPDSERAGQIVRVPVALDEAQIACKVVEFLQEAEDANLADARIIVSGGRGVGGSEGFEPLAELARVLGGTVGASRAAVDEGWIPYAHQVGQTGRTVRPDLYIACGISGAIQHRAGMSTARVIVAINQDPEAPIFEIATYGIVGNLFEIVPALTEQFRKKLAAR